jgi:hypothetical protein
MIQKNSNFFWIYSKKLYFIFSKYDYKKKYAIKYAVENFLKFF